MLRCLEDLLWWRKGGASPNKEGSREDFHSGDENGFPQIYQGCPENIARWGKMEQLKGGDFWLGWVELPSNGQSSRVSCVTIALVLGVDNLQTRSTRTFQIHPLTVDM